MSAYDAHGRHVGKHAAHFATNLPSWCATLPGASALQQIIALHDLRIPSEHENVVTCEANADEKKQQIWTGTGETVK
jgi:hypothetical protein